LDPVRRRERGIRADRGDERGPTRVLRRVAGDRSVEEGEGFAAPGLLGCGMLRVFRGKIVELVGVGDVGGNGLDARGGAADGVVGGGRGQGLRPAERLERRPLGVGGERGRSGGRRNLPAYPGAGSAGKVARRTPRRGRLGFGNASVGVGGVAASGT